MSALIAFDSKCIADNSHGMMCPQLLEYNDPILAYNMIHMWLLLMCLYISFPWELRNIQKHQVDQIFFLFIQYVLQIIYAIFYYSLFNLFLFNIQGTEHQVQKQILKFILNSASPLYILCFSVVLFKFKNHKYIQRAICFFVLYSVMPYNCI